VCETGLEPARPCGHQELNPPQYVLLRVTQYRDVPLDISGVLASAVERVQPRTSPSGCVGQQIGLQTASIDRGPAEWWTRSLIADRAEAFA
jgi:hypothetical protein